METISKSSVLKNNNWENVFDVVISHDDFTKSKPNPQSFLIAAHKLGFSPEECVVVEDSKNGSLAGKTAGMIVIGVLEGNKIPQDLSSADRKMNTLKDITSVL